MKQLPAGSRILIALHTFGQSFMHLPELFARTGFPVDAVVVGKHPVGGSSWLNEVQEATPAEWAAVIDERLKTGKYVFLCISDEPGLIELYKHTWSEASRPLLPFDPDSGMAATVGSKWNFYRWCGQHGLPIPETHECGSLDEVDRLRMELSGNWILKNDRGMGGKSVWPWENPKGSAFPFKTNTTGAAGRWLMQRHEGDAVGAAMFLAVKGRLLAWFGFRKIICNNQGLGPVVLGRGDADARVGELCRAAAAASGITGLTGFDYVTSPERGPLLIDSHMGRCMPISQFSRLYGVDFADALRIHFTGGVGADMEPRAGPDFIKFPEVLELALKEGAGQVRRFCGPDWRMPLAPKGDAWLATRITMGIFFSSLRVRSGRMRRQLFRQAC